jgi:hypothetical protein
MMLRAHTAAVVLVTAMLGHAGPAWAQAARVLDLKFGADGLVTLHAQNVTVRDILAEWARQCGCYIVNADRLAGTPMAIPMSFVSAKQPDVLRSLLRDSGGYALTPRRAGSTSVSEYETIYIINATGPVTQTAAVPTITPIMTRGAPDDEIPPVVPIVVGAEPPTPGAPSAEPPAQSSQPRTTTTPAGGFVITPVSPTTPAPGVPASPPAPGQPTVPGRVTPAPQP